MTEHIIKLEKGIWFNLDPGKISKIIKRETNLMVGTEYEGKPKMVQNGFDKDRSRVGQDRNFQ